MQNSTRETKNDVGKSECQVQGVSAELNSGKTEFQRVYIYGWGIYVVALMYFFLFNFRVLLGLEEMKIWVCFNVET